MAKSAPDAPEIPGLPEAPIHKITRPIVRFLHIEAAGGVVLLLATVAALWIANGDPAVARAFADFWKTEVGFQFGSFRMVHKLQHWINDGLMVIFFFVIGLEVKRELVLGELRDPRRAALPIAAALGGMLLPALLYLSVQLGEKGESGWGIPMATDIAFVVGCMAILGKRFPHPLRVMILSLAIADDIGAILVIAIGYTTGLNLAMLWLALGGLGVTVLIRFLGVRGFLAYTLVGVVVWYGFHESGVHATIAGVILGLMTPTRTHVPPPLFEKALDQARNFFRGDWETVPHRAEKVAAIGHLSRETIPPQEYLEQRLHPWVSFLIMPIFALANAGVPIQVSDLQASVALAVVLGLVVGKPVGIVLFSWLAIRLRIAELPRGVKWGQMIAGGALAGIGFTMALFIAGLAPFDNATLGQAKIGILAGSLISALLGVMIVMLLPQPAPAGEKVEEGPPAPDGAQS
jgi:NhaA family Na+:H+ antiporter